MVDASQACTASCQLWPSCQPRRIEGYRIPEDQSGGSRRIFDPSLAGGATHVAYGSKNRPKLFGGCMSGFAECRHDWRKPPQPCRAPVLEDLARFAGCPALLVISHDGKLLL